jgi:hypothetical protein
MTAKTNGVICPFAQDFGCGSQGITFLKERVMTTAGSRGFVVCIGLAAVACCLLASRAAPQDSSLRPTYGSVELKVGFLPDPFKKELDAGGPIQTKNGGLVAWVARAPDFQLDYTAGAAPLTIRAESKEDTTLLVLLPNGNWVADDDGGGFPNPKLKFENPQSGRYQIWVGTIKKENAKATLLITELKEAK